MATAQEINTAPPGVHYGPPPRTRDPSWPESRRRPRFPHPYGILHCLKRFLAVGLDVSMVIVNSMFAARWKQRSGACVPGILGALIAVSIDISEVVGTLDRSRRIARAHPGCTFILDTIALIVFVVGIVVFIFVDYTWGDGFYRPKPWETDMMLCLHLDYVGLSVRFLFMVWSCIDSCVRKSERKERARAASMPAMSLVTSSTGPSQQPAKGTESG